MRLPIFRRGDFRQPPPLRNNLFYHFEHKIIDINVKKICGSAERPDSSFFQVRGSRSKTEFIGFPDWRARTLPADGPPSSFFQARGSRSETEFIGFPDWRARTLPAAGHK